MSVASSRELKSKRALRVDEIFHLSAPRKFGGSIGTADFCFITIFSAIDFSNGYNCSNFIEEALQSNGMQHSVLAEWYWHKCVHFVNKANG